MIKTLGELAKEYAENGINKEQYRQQRLELIQGIVAGKIAVKPIDFLLLIKKPLDKEAITQRNILTSNKTQISLQPPNTSKKESNPAANSDQQQTTQQEPENGSSWFFMITVVVIIILLIGGIVLFYTQSITKNTQKSNIPIINNTASLSDTKAIKNTAGESLITKFLTDKNWNDDNLEKFITAWSALTTEDQDATTKTKRMQRLHRAIYDQFLEAKALAGINDEKATMKQESLISFANQIGIDDPRFKID